MKVWLLRTTRRLHWIPLSGGKPGLYAACGADGRRNNEPGRPMWYSRLEHVHLTRRSAGTVQCDRCRVLLLDLLQHPIETERRLFDE
jgi:hypothetical protein